MGVCEILRIRKWDTNKYSCTKLLPVESQYGPTPTYVQLSGIVDGNAHVYVHNQHNVLAIKEDVSEMFFKTPQLPKSNPKNYNPMAMTLSPYNGALYFMLMEPNKTSGILAIRDNIPVCKDS
jgi:hypothetical protein